MEVASTVSPYEGEPHALNEDFDEDWLRRFLGCGVQVKIRTKTEFLACCVCVLFSMARSIIRMGSCVRFCCHNSLFLNSHYVRRSLPSVSALEFRCCTEIPLRNQKLTSGERISCNMRHDDFSSRGDRVVSWQVQYSFPQRLQMQRLSSRSSSRSNRTENK